MLDSMEDTVGLFLLEMGVDPSAKVDPAAYDEAIAKLQKAVDDGQIRRSRATTTRARSPGRRLGLDRLVGRHRHPPAGQPEPRSSIPDAGGMISVDTMLIPTGGDVYTASTFMNFFYDPKIAAQIEACVNYIWPVKGAKEESRRSTRRSRRTLIFPTPRMLRDSLRVRPEAIDNASTRRSSRPSSASSRSRPA